MNNDSMNESRLSADRPGQFEANYWYLPVLLTRLHHPFQRMKCLLCHSAFPKDKRSGDKLVCNTIVFATACTCLLLLLPNLHMIYKVVYSPDQLPIISLQPEEDQSSLGGHQPAADSRIPAIAHYYVPKQPSFIWTEALASCSSRPIHGTSFMTSTGSANHSTRQERSQVQTTFRGWTDEDMAQFLQANYPWFIPTFEGYRLPIQRIQAARYFILRYYGGLFLDFMHIRCMDSQYSLAESIDQGRRFAGFLVTGNYQSWVWVGLSDELLAFEANHPLLQFITNRLVVYDAYYGPAPITASFSTGSAFLSICVFDFEHTSRRINSSPHRDNDGSLRGTGSSSIDVPKNSHHSAVDIGIISQQDFFLSGKLFTRDRAHTHGSIGTSIGIGNPLAGEAARTHWQLPALDSKTGGPVNCIVLLFGFSCGIVSCIVLSRCCHIICVLISKEFHGSLHSMKDDD